MKDPTANPKEPSCDSCASLRQQLLQEKRIDMLAEQKTQEEMGMKEPLFELCDKIRETSLALHSYLRHGHLEKVYENGLAHRLRKLGLKVVQQHPLSVYDQDGTVLGEYFTDLFVEDSLLVELKACRAIATEHTAQILGYLRACRMEHGLLINFGARRLEIRKYALSQH